MPGDRPERFAKAAAARPDIVVIDLEDAVAPADKDAARGHTRRWPNDELAWARVVVESVGSGTSAAAVDGQMVDVPVVERARRILATAEQR